MLFIVDSKLKNSFAHFLYLGSVEQADKYTLRAFVLILIKILQYFSKINKSDCHRKLRYTKL